VHNLNQKIEKTNMALSYKIDKVVRNTSDDGVVRVRAIASMVDGDITVSDMVRASFMPDASAEGFIAFDSLTEADVIGWVESSIDVDAVTAGLQAKLDSVKTPVTAVGMPWVAEEEPEEEA
jgi:hypothetical protein